MSKRASTKYLVVHCSATQAKADIGKAEIKRWHQERGWSDIGYHYVIRRNGELEYGRPEGVAGAHVVGFNNVSIGICLVGGIDSKGAAQNNFTEAQFATLKTLLEKLKISYPSAIIQGHRDFPNVAKDCPCFDVKKWWENVSMPKNKVSFWDKFNKRK